METMSAKKLETKPQSGTRTATSEGAAQAGPAATLAELRRFHLVGPAAAGVGGAARRSFIPALLHPFRNAESVRTDYPLFLVPLGGEQNDRLALSLPDLLERSAPPAEAGRVLHDNLLRLERRVRRYMEGAEGPLDARDVLEEAGKGLVEELHLVSPEEEEHLKNGLEALIAAVPAGGRFVPFNEQTPLHLMEQAARSRVLPATAAFVRETRVLAEKIRSLLEVDRLKRGEKEGGKAGAVQDVGSQFINPQALAGVLESRRGGLGMNPQRRERLERTFRTLDEYSHQVPGDGGILVHDESLKEPARRTLGRWILTKAEDPCAEAMRRFDEAAEEIARVLRAVQVARLETEGLYDPPRHDPWLEQLDWESFSREELQLVPPVVVWVSGDRAAEKGLVSLSRLLRSGRPVQVMITVWPAHSPGMTEATGPADAYRLEPAYLGMSHREALVQQTSSSRPFHMLAGFTQGVAATHSALHVVAQGTTLDGSVPPVGAWLAMGAAVEARAHPLFRYNPEAGATWAERLDFSENPSPETDWPVYEVAVKKDGRETSLRLPFTFADYAILEPAFEAQFLPIAERLSEEDLVPMDEYLGLSGEQSAHKIPFVWAVGADAKPVRLAVTRRMALACRDRLDFWRTLQELAGARNEYARRAAEQVRRQMEDAAREDLEKLKAEHADQMQRVRDQATEEAMARLSAALMEVDPAELISLPPASSPLAAFAGKSVDEVAASLMELLDLEKLETESKASAAGGDKVDDVASKLLGLIGPDDLETSTQ